MSVFGGGRVNADPKTQSQLRASLWAGQEGIDELAADVAALDAEIDALAGFAGPIEAIFDSTAAVGQPVYVSSAGHVQLADADSPSTAGVVGIVSAGASAGNTGEYVPAGVITQADWTTATGSASLTAGMLYFLSGTTGQLTTTAPTVGTVIRCARALSATALLVAIGPGVKL